MDGYAGWIVFFRLIYSASKIGYLFRKKMKKVWREGFFWKHKNYLSLCDFEKRTIYNCKWEWV